MKLRKNVVKELAWQASRAELGDARRSQRAAAIIESLATFPQLSFPDAMGSEAAIEGGYRFIPQPNDVADPASPAPASFRYKSISPHFAIWGYDIAVERDAEELLELTDVTPASVTLTGSGVVTVRTPDGAVHTVDLGAGGTKTIAT